MFVHANINLLNWESKFFGRRLGCVAFDDAAPCLTFREFIDFALVQAKVAAQATVQMDALGALGFQLVEGEIECCYTLPVNLGNTIITALPAAEMRVADTTDIPALRVLAAQTLTLSRFRPPWFSDKERRRFYAQWVENAVHGSFDHLCLVADGPTGMEGLVTLRDIGEQTARIGLLAVSSVARGRGTGKLLCYAALSWCYSHGFSQLRVATQTANLPALKLYIASGAQIMHVTYWLYRGSYDSA